MENKEQRDTKSNMHSRNKHKGRYDLNALIKIRPELTSFLIKNKYNVESIDFAKPEAVRLLNAALLKQFYGIEYWNLPADYLCPPIPGRADYIHHVADLLAETNNGVIPRGMSVNCLDIGVGASCIYPILGSQEYGWSFVASDIDSKALDYAKNNVVSNSNLEGLFQFRMQHNAKHVFSGVVRKEDSFDVTICNPPFHSSKVEANKAAFKKITNLSRKQGGKKVKNFGGQANELWCKGGELTFIKTMIVESKEHKYSSFWFTSLVSKESNLKTIYSTLDIVGAKEVKTIAMGQGNKVSRIVAWTFFTKEKQQEWVKTKYASLNE